MFRLCEEYRLTIREFTELCRRYGKSAEKSTLIRKKEFESKNRALKHFDEFYASVYGDMWLDIREALLEPENKHMAVVNNFSDTERIRSELELEGAICLKSIYDSYKQYLDEKRENNKKKAFLRKAQTKDDTNNNTQTTSIDLNNPDHDANIRESISPNENHEEPIESIKPLSPVQLKSIDADLNETVIDRSRIITSSHDTAGLHEFVPATKLRGMDDWITESEYYSHYQKGSDFSVQVEKESVISFPEHLHVYTYEYENNTKFKAPKKGSTDVLDYYLIDGVSILPILALDLQPGDSVLDMCAAPGGKMLTMIQTLMPRLMVANEKVSSRTKYIEEIMECFVGDIDEWNEKLFIIAEDARWIDHKNAYNKILVDAPCTVDRHSLHSVEDNIFKPNMVKERLRMPELQTEILINALKIIPVGGTVVYCTSTLSPIQNDGVVQMALKRAWEEDNSALVVKDMSAGLQPLKCLYKFWKKNVRYGHLVLPSITNNWGPIYFSKIVKTQ
ncbi:hypothetical protein KM043_015418 [Ampulex compressa]|nr:hypothetical protein KM043_015418 [Ampulex compressa]